MLHDSLTILEPGKQARFPDHQARTTARLSERCVLRELRGPSGKKALLEVTAVTHVQAFYDETQTIIGLVSIMD